MRAGNQYLVSQETREATIKSAGDDYAATGSMIITNDEGMPPPFNPLFELCATQFGGKSSRSEPDSASSQRAETWDAWRFCNE